MIFLIYFLPLLNFILLLFLGTYLGYYGTVFIGLLNLIICVFLSFFFFLIVIQGNLVVLFDFSFNFFNIIIPTKWVFIFDSITIIMLFLVSFVSLVVHLYSSHYMEYDVHFIRFYSLLSLFTFFMFFLVTSTNLIQLFFGWEGVGLCSYLLINFWFTRIQANKAAIKAMLVNRIGDISLLLSISIVYYLFQTTEFSIIFNLFYYYKNVFFTFLNFDFKVLDLISLFLLIAAMGKSAQLFLHTWLPDAMEGPTPVSALIHAATMVTAGIFLIIRMSFLFEFSNLILFLIIFFGVLTSFFSGFFALVQNDLKKIVAYSTCSQLGFMMLACGLSRYDVALFHLFNHGFFKALLFLSSGAIIHNLFDEQDIRKMGSLYYFMPFTYLCFFVGTLALVGFPFLTGFFSKEVIITIFFFKKKIYYFFLYFLILISLCFTTLYSFRLIFYVFFFKINGFYSTYKYLEDTKDTIFFSLVLLIIPSIFFGFFFKDLFIGFGTTFFSLSIFFNITSFYINQFEFLYFFFKLIPLFLTIISFFIVYYYYFNNSTNKSIWFFLKKKYYFIFFSFLSNKGYFDLIYNFFFINFFLNKSFFITFKKLDKNFFEFFGPFGFFYFLNNIKKIYIYIFNSYIYNYLFFLLLSFIFIFFFYNIYIYIIFFLFLYFFFEKVINF